jgi:plasmid maintenance system killer protein
MPQGSGSYWLDLTPHSSQGTWNLPGLRLHQLQGDYAECYAVDVSGNWRIVFSFDGEHVVDVDYLDYH